MKGKTLQGGKPFHRKYFFFLTEQKRYLEKMLLAFVLWACSRAVMTLVLVYILSECRARAADGGIFVVRVQWLCTLLDVKVGQTCEWERERGRHAVSSASKRTTCTIKRIAVDISTCDLFSYPVHGNFLRTVKIKSCIFLWNSPFKQCCEFWFQLYCQ